MTSSSFHMKFFYDFDTCLLCWNLTGQFICGNKSCSEEEDLHSYEVNFNYKEAGELKQALVKLRVCPRCAHKLNYKKERERKRQLRREEKENQKRRRHEDECDHHFDSQVQDEDHDNTLVRIQTEKQKPETAKQVHDKAGQSSGVGSEAKQEVQTNQEFDDYFTGMFL
ncbi:hypothetical protein O6H91_Y249600 [Diphasiastrum complanatum]|nr:hypothetical protein O6H91_Y249600 [Diphasiastrum complanatum]